jgi:hypothetical protein
MGLLIDSNDFVGTFELPKTTFSKIDSYISRYEKPYLYKILGQELADLFIADLTNQVPVTPIYLKIYEFLMFQNRGINFISEGLKPILLGLIWWEYMKDNNVKATTTGEVQQQNEVSVNVTFGRLFNYYNNSIYSIIALQTYIELNKEDYPDFLGVKFKLNLPGV